MIKKMDAVLIFQYLIVGVIVALGPFVGKLLYKIAPEELKESTTFLIVLKKLLFFSIVVAFFFTIDIIFLRACLVVLLVYYVYDIYRHKIFDKNNYYLLYTALGIFLGFVNMKYLFIPSSLAFLLGIPTALLNNNRRISVFVKMFIVFFAFYLTAFLLSNYYFVI